MYGDHHQQPQKDCRYDEPDPFLVVREPCMRMIGPVHGQPTFHAAPNPTPYHTSYGLMTEHRRPWQRAMLTRSGQSLGAPGLAVGAPWLSARGLGAPPIRAGACHTVDMAAAKLSTSGQPLPQASETGPGSPGLQRSLSRGSPIWDGVVPALSHQGVKS
jgi:hypothetical protein